MYLGPELLRQGELNAIGDVDKKIIHIVKKKKLFRLRMGL